MVANEEKCYNILKTVFNDAACYGILVNIQKESNFRPTALGDKGTSYGICQWHNGKVKRWDRMKNWCQENHLDDTSIEGQTSFIIYELKKHYPSTYKYLLAVENTEDGAYNAAYRWCYYYEVPANKAASSEKRGNLARAKFQAESVVESHPEEWNNVTIDTEPFVDEPIPEPEPVKEPDPIPEKKTIEVGDKVFVNGPYYCLPTFPIRTGKANGIATVVRILSSERHPFFVKADKPNKFIGWVNAKDVKPSK